MFTIVINYPPDYDTLTRWSKRLFAVFYACGAAGVTSLVAGIVLWFLDKPLWLSLSLAGIWILLGIPQMFAESLMTQVDQRRLLLFNAEYATD